MTPEQADRERAAETYLGPILQNAQQYRAANGPDAVYTLWMPEDGLPAFWPELCQLAAQHNIQARTYPGTCTNPR